MSCVEKRHMSQRTGNMLHHRFPNSFTDLFMDDTDREVSTLTDRAFRSLCVGDDAVYSDELLYGYSPFSCHKPLVGDPTKKTHQKESKRHGQKKTDKSNVLPWQQQQQQQKNMSHMSSFLRALTATKESCEGMLIQNGSTMDSNGESWDKSALRSIQRELSEFSSDYHSSLTDGHFKHHHRNHDKSTKIKNGKSTVKLMKLNIKNFFLHSEFSPFQTWSDFNRFPFGREDASILPTDSIPKWCDLPFYKELTEAHTQKTCTDETQHSHTERSPHAEETPSGQRTRAEPSPPTAPKPQTLPSPPKVLPKPSVTQAQKRCSSDGADVSTAPWRRARSRANSAIPANHPAIPSKDSCLTTVDESVLLVTHEAKSVEVKAVEEVSSLASTPFSICQLMTPVIPSRQPTDTSEILQTVFSPSALDLPCRPQSEVKLTSEPLVKRDGYKSLASSILFNLKDNRKRVKSRYSPPRFKPLEVPEGGSRSPQSDGLKQQDGSEGNASGLSTPAILKDVYSPVYSPDVCIAKHHTDRPLSEDYLLSNILQTKRESTGSVGEEGPVTLMKKTRSPMVKKQNYPSLNLYKKADLVDCDMTYRQAPLSANAPVLSDQPLEADGIPPYISPIDTTFSQNTVSPDKERPPDGNSTGAQPVGLKEKDQRMSTTDVIRAAKEAINAEKNKALSVAQSESNRKCEKIEPDERIAWPDETYDSSESDLNVPSHQRNEVDKNVPVKREPPPVPKRNFAKSDIEFALEKQKTREKPTNGEMRSKKMDQLAKDSKTVQRRGKHIFSDRQNSYIKHQRYTVKDSGRGDVHKEGDVNVTAETEKDEEMAPVREMGDSEHIIHDLNALKELERARLTEGEKIRSKAGVVNIDEEARAKNDLISRELRNIKKGMMSMRGNTQAKRDIFSRSEEQVKQETFTKTDSNSVVNRALLNENYDRATMALEEIITDRQTRRNKTTHHDAEGCTSTVQSKTCLKDSITEAKEKQNGAAYMQNDLRERLGDLRDHNHMKQILSHTEPKPGETHRSGCRIALPGMDKVSNELHALLKNKAKRVNDKLTNSSVTDDPEIVNPCPAVKEDATENPPQDDQSKMLGTPSVPPRSKKGLNRRHESIVTQKDQVEHEEGIHDNEQTQVKEAGREQKEANGVSPTEALTSQNKTGGNEKMTDGLNNSRLKGFTATNAVLGDPISPSNTTQFENRPPELSGNVSGANLLQTDVMTPIEATSANSKIKSEKPCSRKQTDHLVTSDETNDLEIEPDKAAECEVNMHNEAVCETPLRLVNGVSASQSPPDHASLSSKSSYFSVESASHRHAETESNVYQSLENLIAEVEAIDEMGQKVPENFTQDWARPEMEYYSLNDRQTDSLYMKRLLKSPVEEEVPHTDLTERDDTSAGRSIALEENNHTPATVLPQTSGIPALFKIKDNSFSDTPKKPAQPWSPRGSLSGSERGEEEQHPAERTADEPPARGSTSAAKELFEPNGILSNQSKPLSNPQRETPKKPQAGQLLVVPQEPDRFPGLSPSSEGVDSLTNSTADTADEMPMTSVVPVEQDMSKIPSEHSGSTYSGNESQTGLPKPPAVLPKSEKAVLKALKLANRRMKKEEGHKSSQSSSKHKSSRHKTDKSEPKSSGEKKFKERKDDHQQGRHSNDRGDQLPTDTGSHEERNPHIRADRGQTTRRQDSVETVTGVVPEKRGRSNYRHIREKPEQRPYSSDRVISHVPVYKAHLEERAISERPLPRTQSIDRAADKDQLSADGSADEKLDPRRQRIEKSIIDGFQQRGRTRDKISSDKPLRRSHSTDTCSSEVPHPSTLSRQSSHTSQLSRQSSVEHAIVTQSFPMTQRKLLQDPDSGQFFFVDMPVQVKTKTFFDPETGTYVQLPVQPPEGAAVLQASPMEVLPPPVVVYHSFVPVPLSPMAQKSTIQAAPMESEELRHQRSGHTRCTEGHPYLEPVYGQNDRMLGEFIGTEELDCPS